jgi:hypothetical protein
MNNTACIALGAENLLSKCANLQADESLLIICEDPSLGWYDSKTPEFIAETARKMGLSPTIMFVGKPENDLDPKVVEAIDDNDCTIYFARIGDQDRFAQLPPGKRSVMCYIRDIEMLGSQYGQASYPAFREVKNAVDDVLLNAEQIEITCPLGTRYIGSATNKARKNKTDVSVLRFPLGVPLPLDASKFSGTVALSHFLTPTGSKSYHPASVKLEGVTYAEVNDGKITGYRGDQRQIGKIEAQYDMVSKKFNIERNIVHSWHAGIHPGCDYLTKAADDPDRWSNTVFTNPRFLHFHTCGDYAPAEICWMVLDPTISVDGEKLWDNGRLELNHFIQTRSCLNKWPELATLFENPSQGVGL